jgi:hypothetical protein
MVIHSLVLTEDAHITQLLCEDVFGNGRLGHVRPVEVVHAIRSHGSTLQLEIIRLRVEREVPAKIQPPQARRNTLTHPWTSMSSLILSIKTLILSHLIRLHSLWKSKYSYCTLGTSS